MDWKIAVQKDNAVEIPKTWLFIHYYEALNILFRTENTLRVFVYLVLKNNMRERWPDAEIQISESEKSTIAKVAARRITQARGYGYLGYEIASPLMHLNSGELTRLIMSNVHWPTFKPYFKGKQEIIQSKLEEISTVRNALAHFRPIKNEDIEMIKQNVRHAFAGIEVLLADVLNINTTVPTNTTEIWYRPLMGLQTEPCKVSLFQSKSAEWVRVELIYVPGILSRHVYWEGHLQFQTFKLNTSSIPRVIPELASFCTFINESARGYLSKADDTPTLAKHVSIVFSRAILRQHSNEVEAALGKLQQTIKQEFDLVREDHLARGSLIEFVRVRAVKKDGQTWFQVMVEDLACPFGEDDPPEYWEIS